MRHADSCSRNKCSPWQMIVRKTSFSVQWVGECFSSTRVTEHRGGADVGLSWGMQPHHSQSRAIGRNSHDRGRVWAEADGRVEESAEPQRLLSFCSAKESFVAGPKQCATTHISRRAIRRKGELQRRDAALQCLVEGARQMRPR